MKMYEVELNVVFNKTVNVRANSMAEAVDKVADIFINTDLISLGTDELVDVSCGTKDVCEHEECCDEDCDCCPYDDEEESLFDELY